MWYRKLTPLLDHLARMRESWVQWAGRYQHRPDSNVTRTHTEQMNNDGKIVQKMEVEDPILRSFRVRHKTVLWMEASGGGSRSGTGRLSALLDVHSGAATF